MPYIMPCRWAAFATVLPPDPARQSASKGMTLPMTRLILLTQLMLAALVLSNAASADQSDHAIPASVTPNTLINVKAYGATGDGHTDDSKAIKAAFAAANATGGQATLYFPATPGGGYAYCPASEPTLDVSSPNLTLAGEGRASIILTCQTGGDFIHVHSAAGPHLVGFQMRNIAIYATGRDPASGALVHLENVNTFNIDGSEFAAYYGGLFLDGAVHGTVTGTNITSDANFSRFAAGSYLVKASRSPAGMNTSEVHFDSMELRGQSGNNNLDSALLVTGSDGIIFANPHIGFARYGIKLVPADDTTQLTGLVVRGGSLDTCGADCLFVGAPDKGYHGVFGAHDLDFSAIYNSGQNGIRWKMATTGAVLWNRLNVSFAWQIGQAGIELEQADHIVLAPGWVIQGVGMHVPPGGCTEDTCTGITLDSATNNIVIGDGIVDKGRSANGGCAIRIAVGADKISTGTLRNQGMTKGLCDVSTTANKAIGTVLNW